MSNAYALKPGIYYIGDPGLIIKKTPEGTKLIEAIWETFYKDMNQFLHLFIDDIDIYVTRTAEGDGMYGDVGTDTGVICILDVSKIQADTRFKDYQQLKGCHILETQDIVTVKMTHFNLYFSNGYQILTT
jgi:hypothetical protein